MQITPAEDVPLPHERVAHTSSKHSTFQSSSDQAVPHPTGQVAQSASEDTTGTATERGVNPATNQGPHNDVEVEEVVLPSIESPTENPPNDDDYGTDSTVVLARFQLRRRAVAWMERTYSDLPNGSIVQPPSYYRRSRSSPAGRPAVWIKDYVWGHIRPRRLSNDRFADMSLAERERWARRQRRAWEQEDEIDEEEGREGEIEGG
ncbi:hypothetical protein QBC45DRAFT_388138 [Copromyces sp. CBS 386.78]|nr:hypothetical protein QBC45DRAFT_388138 [Copromyces sp. CBS 386.78]